MNYRIINRKKAMIKTIVALWKILFCHFDY
nr:MAG TPA: hypothetical protein [Caudoviricetes sp.]